MEGFWKMCLFLFQTFFTFSHTWINLTHGFIQLGSSVQAPPRDYCIFHYPVIYEESQGFQALTNQDFMQGNKGLKPKDGFFYGWSTYPHRTYPPSRNKALLRLRANQPLVSVNKGRLFKPHLFQGFKRFQTSIFSALAALLLTGDLDGKSAASGWNQRDPWLENGIDLGSDLGGTASWEIYTSLEWWWLKHQEILPTYP